MRQLFLVFYIAGLLFGIDTVAIADSPEEIQVLIDVSGSMKQNDPDNLRTDATQLLISLLPDKAKVTLWLFAEQTTPLSQSDAVDEAWRQQALKDSKAIHARGLFTDIEKAIDTALKNSLEAEGDKNLILLTDGMVDISKDIMVSADSRERILSEWIPRLRQHRIKVRTIALSEQADRELLERLAFDTDGWNETAESAEQLQRLFLKMMQKVAPKDTVPLDGNRFNIDASIREFSVLVFKKAGTSPTQLIRPDQHKIGKQQALADNVAWLETSGYDLITVAQPMAGDWQIEAEIDPDNQVMILTDLKLQLEGLHQFVGEKEPLALELYFTEQDKLIDRPDFVDLVTLSLAVDQQAPATIPSLKDRPGYFALS
ncbi:MAG: VWA domain-containing protein, partial [Methylomonas sp.]|nr:VWA domain-containing protein [Methylomonas sp.]